MLNPGHKTLLYLGNQFAKLRFGVRIPALRIYNPQATKDKKIQWEYLKDERYTIGRDPRSCNIIIDDPHVSGVHFSLTRDPNQNKEQFVLEEQSNSNGIYYHGKPIKVLKLKNNTTWFLGPAKDAIKIKYIYPPIWYVRGAIYSSYLITGVILYITSQLMWINFVEIPKISVKPLPEVSEQPIIVTASDGEIIYRTRNKRHEPDAQSLGEFSAYLLKALIASEDSRYYQHNGVDLRGITRAVTSLGREGASTITQQVASTFFPNYVPKQEKSMTRKLREMILALKLENAYKKDDILLSYLNSVDLGIRIRGFKDAAKVYFNKSVKNLTLNEAATLVAILPGPNGFDFCKNRDEESKKFGGANSYKFLRRRRDRVINRIFALKMIDKKQADNALQEDINPDPKVCQPVNSGIYPYFSDYVLFDKSQLPFLKEREAKRGNLIVETGLNLEMQKQAEITLKNAIKSDGATYKFSQGALITINAKTGNILAMVGGIDYQTSKFNRTYQAKRQPASTFKIFSYIAALKTGISPETKYSCNPLNWQGQNFYGCQRSKSKTLNMFDGMALSENVIAARIAQEVGLEKVKQTAKRMGINSQLDLIPGLVIGQSEVTLLEITAAYSVLANQGIKNPPHAINRILDSNSCTNIEDFRTCKVIYSYKEEPTANQQVIEPKVALLMTKLLQGVVQRPEGTGYKAFLGLKEEAGKTGTNDNNKDLWFIGYIPSKKLVTGIWLGNDDSRLNTTGKSAEAAKIWHDYMEKVLKLK